MKTMVLLFLSTAAAVAVPGHAAASSLFSIQQQHHHHQHEESSNSLVRNGQPDYSSSSSRILQNVDPSFLDLYAWSSYYYDYKDLSDDIVFPDEVDCKCTESDGCTASHEFHVEDTCVIIHSPREGGSVILSSEDDGVCANGYSGNFDCPEEIGDDPCKNPLPVDECENDGVIAPLRNWCIRSSEPMGPFVMPMVKVKSYSSLANCESGVNVTEYFLPVDEDVCLQTAIASFYDEVSFVKLVPGSIRTSCTTPQGQDEERQLVVEHFSDRLCSKPFANEDNNAVSGNSYNLTPSACFFKNLVDDELQNPVRCSAFVNTLIDDHYLTADCNGATIYCKPLVDQINFATRIVGSSSSSGAAKSLAAAATTIWMLALFLK